MPHSSIDDASMAAELGATWVGPKRVAFVVNNDRSFLSHRATWATALQASGSSIVVVAEDTGRRDQVESLGIRFIDVRIGRETSSIASTLVASLRILVVLLRLRPKTVFLSASVAYTIGWPAALILRRSKFIRLIAGAGMAMSESRMGSLGSRVVVASARTSARLRNVWTVFQIEQDRELFGRYQMYHADRASLVPGTGIRAEGWARDDAGPMAPPRKVLFASRIYWEKGIGEFIDAAQLLLGEPFEFVVAGGFDEGVESAIDPATVERWLALPNVQFTGHVDNMRALLTDAWLLVFPTKHPEGTPRILIEAAANGLPVLCSNIAGCVAVVEHQRTGIVMDSTDAAVIASWIRKLDQDDEQWRRLSNEAQEAAQKRFDLSVVLPDILALAGAHERVASGRVS